MTLNNNKLHFQKCMQDCFLYVGLKIAAEGYGIFFSSNFQEEIRN